MQGSFTYHHFGGILGSLWGDLGSFWGHFGSFGESILMAFGDHLGAENIAVCDPTIKELSICSLPRWAPKITVIYNKFDLKLRNIYFKVKFGSKINIFVILKPNVELFLIHFDFRSFLKSKIVF